MRGDIALCFIAYLLCRYRIIFLSGIQVSGQEIVGCRAAVVNIDHGIAVGVGMVVTEAGVFEGLL